MALNQKITTILFDLDGTLLPMDEDKFVKAYFGELAKKAAEHGCPDGEKLTAAVWKGTKAMVKNDGSEKNIDRFWKVFALEMGREALGLRPVFDRFYAEEFNRVKGSVGENPLAAPAVRGLREKGYEVILATNPLFPAVGVGTRLSWIGLTPGDFLEVTSYEEYSSCKPNPAYFGEILERTGKKPEECLMVGNDVSEDMAARALGMRVFLLTDCLINRNSEDISAFPNGGFPELLTYVKALNAVSF